MSTNGTNAVGTEARLNGESEYSPAFEYAHDLDAGERAALRKLLAESRPSHTVSSRSADLHDALDDNKDFVLAPLVDKIAYGIAKGLVVALKELERHIAGETKKVGDSVDRRLDILQASMLEMSKFIADQNATNSSVQQRFDELNTGIEGLDARQAADSEALRSEVRQNSAAAEQHIEKLVESIKHTETKQKSDLIALRSETAEMSAALTQRIDSTAAALQELDARQGAHISKLEVESKAFSQSVSERLDGICSDLGVQQEDIAALKTGLCDFTTKMDGIVERLDRQAEAVRSMCTAFSQRESELEQLVDGLARLRAYPTPMAANRL